MESELYPISAGGCSGFQCSMAFENVAILKSTVGGALALGFAEVEIRLGFGQCSACFPGSPWGD